MVVINRMLPSPDQQRLFGNLQSNIYNNKILQIIDLVRNYKSNLFRN